MISCSSAIRLYPMLLNILRLTMALICTVLPFELPLLYLKYVSLVKRPGLSTTRFYRYKNVSLTRVYNSKVAPILQDDIKSSSTRWPFSISGCKKLCSIWSNVANLNLRCKITSERELWTHWVYHSIHQHLKLIQTGHCYKCYFYQNGERGIFYQSIC